MIFVGKRWFGTGNSLISIFSVTLACHYVSCVLPFTFMLSVVVQSNRKLKCKLVLFGIIDLLQYFVLQFRSQHTCTCTDLMSCVFTLQLPWCIGGVAERICIGPSTPVQSRSGQLAIFWRLFEQPQHWQLLFLWVTV